MTKYILFISALMFSGCAQTRVYQRNFNQVLSHLNRKYSVDFSTVDTCKVCPTLTIQVTNDVLPVADKQIGQSLLMLLTSEDLTVNEFIPEKKLEYTLESEFIGKTTEKFRLEATPDNHSKITVNFFSHFLCFFSLERRREREYLAELDRELSEGRVINGYSSPLWPVANLIIWSSVKEAEQERNTTTDPTVTSEDTPSGVQ